MRKTIFITAAALLCLLGTGYVQAQHVPTLDEVVYGGLIHTKGSTYVNWLEDGEHYSKTEKIRQEVTTSCLTGQKTTRKRHLSRLRCS